MTQRQKQLVPPGDQDLEDTAELPALDLGSFQETADAAHDSAARSDAEAQPVVAAPPREPGDSDLESNLSSLTVSLRELENQLNHKSEQLSLFEREVGARDARIEELRAELQKREEDLRAIDARMAERESSLQELHTSRAALGQQLQSTENELGTVRQRHAQLETERSRHHEQQAQLEGELTELRQRGERYRETLQNVEGKRGFFDSLMGERDRTDADHQARIGALNKLNDDMKRAIAVREQELTTLLDRARMRGDDLQRQLQESTAREAQLSADLKATLSQGDERQKQLLAELARTEALSASSGQLKLQLEESVNENAAIRERLEEFERELADHREMVRAQQQQMSTLRAAEEALRSDRNAAEDGIRRYESDLRQRDATIARLEKSEAELRAQNAELTRQVEKREALIKRLETEASSSAAVLGNIRQNLERIGGNPQKPETVPMPTGSTSARLAAVSPINLTQSNRFALLPSGPRVEHLLVRTEGDTGIVHQLGKRTTIGRKSDNDLKIEEDFISRHHALILVGERETVIEDLNSANGVYVNGSRVARKELREGDLVTIGKTAYRYVLKPVSERPS